MTYVNIDVTADHLLPVEASALIKMIAKKRKYDEQCRRREAHGVEQAIIILWLELLGEYRGEEGEDGELPPSQVSDLGPL